MAAFYPGVLDRLCEIFNDDIYVSFVSARECAVHPASKFSRSAVKAVSKEMFQNPRFLDDDIDNLTADVYIYERANKNFRRI
jgi:hypothetical protein